MLCLYAGRWHHQLLVQANRVHSALRTEYSLFDCLCDCLNGQKCTESIILISIAGVATSILLMPDS